MFKFFKAKLEERRLKEHAQWVEYEDQKITEYEQSLAKYKQLLEDFTNNYLPVRTRCIEVIRKHSLGRYPLKDVLSVTYLKDNKVEFKVYDVKEEYWNEKKTLFKDDVLLDETIQLNTLGLLRHGYEGYFETYPEDTRVKKDLDALRDVTEGFASKVNYYTCVPSV